MKQIVDIVFAPVPWLAKLLVYTFGSPESALMSRITETVFWVKVPLYSALVGMLLYVLATLGLNPATAVNEPRLLPCAVALAYTFTCLALSHYRAARHLQRLRIGNTRPPG